MSYVTVTHHAARVVEWAGGHAGRGRRGGGGGRQRVAGRQARGRVVQHASCTKLATQMTSSRGVATR